MKSLKSHFWIAQMLIVGIFLFSCKKQSTDPIPTQAEDPQVTINKVTFTESTPTLPVLPFTSAPNSTAVLMAKANAKIYIFLKTPEGGEFLVSGFTYDVNENKFTSLKKLSTGSFIQASGLNSPLMAIDNNEQLWNANPTIMSRYATLTDSWTSYTASTNSGTNNGACYLLNKMYYAGNSANATASFKYLDFGAGSVWNNAADLPYLAESPALQAYNSRYIYAIGGEKTTGSAITKKFTIYDTQSDKWTAATDLPFDYYSSINHHSTTILKNKYLMVYSKNNKIYLYDLEAKIWRTTPAVDLGTFSGINVNIFSNSSLGKDDGDTLYLTYMNNKGEFNTKKYVLNL
ncbi:hypothetical protein [Pedobacter sp. Hv1]|uniref:hypothetical protein n=1 Tax=Pedobacter sp. Hv1 TaxID=1740090 RepID=UPI0006D8C99D|nr:hypothetical protein [Pedobacter sp. Hv1]KQB98865.1 hypothetical protein AQF98_21235 [Pedobacter sp. Hv1]